MGYTAPNWVNGKPPAINAARLNDLCSTVQTLDETMPTKQDKLTFDNVPTSGSSNPVKSSGIYTALQGKQSSLTFDSTPTQGSTNPVTSGGVYDHRVVVGQKEGETLGTNATSEGTNTIASGANSHAEGNATSATGSNSHSEGWSTLASGSCSHGEGYETTASGGFSHAEGQSTESSGDCSHGEGWGTVASGDFSHAEGVDTVASGTSSHAEGAACSANGENSHAEGTSTIANGVSQHVFGKSNIADTTSVEIVGWGANTSNRKNIRTLDQSGNMTIAGTLTQSSDAKLKTVEGEIPDVSEIHAVRFRWNDVNGQHDDLDHVGYIAQDVEKVAPFMVKNDSNGYKALDYIAFLCAKMELLERRVKELEEKKE